MGVCVGWGWVYHTLHVQCVRLVEPFKHDFLLNGFPGMEALMSSRVAVRLRRDGPVFAIGRFGMVRTNQTPDLDTQFVARLVVLCLAALFIWPVISSCWTPGSTTKLLSAI